MAPTASSHCPLWLTRRGQGVIQAFSHAIAPPCSFIFMNVSFSLLKLRHHTAHSLLTHTRVCSASCTYPPALSSLSVQGPMNVWGRKTPQGSTGRIFVGSLFPSAPVYSRQYRGFLQWVIQSNEVMPLFWSVFCLFCTDFLRTYVLLMELRSSTCC